MQNTSSEIDYFVSVGSNTRIEDMLENHPVSMTPSCYYLITWLDKTGYAYQACGIYGSMEL